MKKLISIILFAVMLFSLCTAVFAADQDLIYDHDATLNASFVKYRNITVKSGVTLTIDKSSGFEITGDILVEEGGKIICNGVGNGDFNFTMCKQDAVVSGMELYFKFKSGSSVEVRRVTNGYAAIAAMDCWDFAGGWCPSFKWDASVQGWCLTLATNENLSDAPIYHSERDMGTAELLAGRLNQLNLFKGSDKGYELSREGSRVEALVMLIRLLGKEETALSGDWTHPFTDVPAWADKYVGYAYESGLTQGSGATTFGTGKANAQMYFTFVLRALGKTDAGEYKVYDHAFELMGETGILSTENDSYEVCSHPFWRADMAVISYRALSAQTADGKQLSQKLIADGVFTASDFSAATH